MTLILVADSWEEPTDAQFVAAKAAGYSAWLGYFKETATDNIYHGWADATFRRAQAAGLLTGDYCSQLDDPAWVRARAASLGIVAILDDESGIDPDNAGTDAWLAAAGAGLYGGSAVQATHLTHAHPFYVFSEYPAGGNPSTVNWPPGIAAPPQPKGWQYSDKGSIGGLAIDLSVFDDAIYEEGAVNNVGYVVEYTDPNYDSGAAAIWLVRPDFSARIHMATSPDVTFAESSGAVVGTISATQMAQIPDLTVGVSTPSAPGALALAGSIKDNGDGTSTLTGSATPG